MGNKESEKPVIVAQVVGKWIGGGVESVVMNYYQHIDRSRIQFDFICDADSTCIPYKEIEKLGGRVIICPPYQKLRSYLKFLIRLFKEQKYRIVHSHINTLSVFPLFAAKLAGVKVRISHSHNTSCRRDLKRNILKHLLRLFSKVWATDLFACSEKAGRFQFGNRAYEDGRVKIIHNAIDLKKYKFDNDAREKLRAGLSIPSDALVFGHIGRFVGQKNHLFLIERFSEIIAEYPSAILVLVGEGPLKNRIKLRAAELRISQSIRFVDWCEKVEKYYSVFDAFVLPSLYEGLPLVGIEAQANGLPCLFSESISPEVVVLPTSKIDKLGAGFGAEFKIMKRIDDTALYFAHRCLDISKEAKNLETAYNRGLARV